MGGATRDAPFTSRGSREPDEIGFEDCMSTTKTCGMADDPGICGTGMIVCAEFRRAAGEKGERGG
jgi:hypothetical protein